jgi:hypothetical protein
MPSTYHESTVHIARKIADSLTVWLSTVAPGHCALLFGSPRLSLHHHDGPHIIDKEPDACISLSHDDVAIRRELMRLGYPQILVEIGYSETYKDLINDARDWLLFSSGKVLSVLIFKWVRPSQQEDFGDVSKWRLFAELYERFVVIYYLSLLSIEFESETSIIKTPLYAMENGSRSSLVPIPLQL